MSILNVICAEGTQSTLHRATYEFSDYPGDWPEVGVAVPHSQVEFDIEVANICDKGSQV